MINGIRNAPTPPPGPPLYPTTERAQPPYILSTPRNIQSPPTSPSPRQRKRHSPIPSQQEAPTPPRYRTPRYDMDGVGKIRRYSLGIILLTGRPTEREIKTQYSILEIIYHPDKHDS